MPIKKQFRRRILVVDGDTRFLRSCADMLNEQGYEVLTATDGFEALFVLRGGSPDLLITELTLPRMSGFELLSIVRTRFPMMAVIAVSSDYSALTAPEEAICDAFLAKGPNLDFELLERVRALISESPLRGARAKSDKAPVWIPRTGSGYIILTCPECLRSFSAVQRKPGAVLETCLCCGADVPFEMSSIHVPPAPPAKSPQQRARITRANSQRILSEGRELRRRPPSRRGR